jgi:hypothetical protein
MHLAKAVVISHVLELHHILVALDLHKLHILPRHCQQNVLDLANICFAMICFAMVGYGPHHCANVEHSRYSSNQTIAKEYLEFTHVNGISMPNTLHVELICLLSQPTLVKV